MRCVNSRRVWLRTRRLRGRFDRRRAHQHQDRLAATRRKERREEVNGEQQGRERESLPRRPRRRCLPASPETPPLDRSNSPRNSATSSRKPSNRKRKHPPGSARNSSPNRVNSNEKTRKRSRNPRAKCGAPCARFARSGHEHSSLAGAVCTRALEQVKNKSKENNELYEQLSAQMKRFTSVASVVKV